MMTAATAFGCESIARWLVLSSVVVAFIRFAKNRSSSGAIALSSLDTMNHDGFVFHATPDTWAPKAETAIGPCVAASTRASLAGRSDAKCFTTHPWAGGGGGAASAATAPMDSAIEAATAARSPAVSEHQVFMEQPPLLKPIN